MDNGTIRSKFDRVRMFPGSTTAELRATVEEVRNGTRCQHKPLLPVERLKMIEDEIAVREADGDFVRKFY